MGSRVVLADMQPQGDQAYVPGGKLEGVVELESDNGVVFPYNVGEKFHVQAIQVSQGATMAAGIEILHCEIAELGKQVQRGTIAKAFRVEGNRITLRVHVDNLEVASPMIKPNGGINQPGPAKPRARGAKASERIEWISPATAAYAQELGHWPHGAKFVPEFTGELEHDGKTLRWFFFHQEELLRIEDAWGGDIPDDGRDAAADLYARALMGEFGDELCTSPPAWEAPPPDDEDIPPDEYIPF